MTNIKNMTLSGKQEQNNDNKLRTLFKITQIVYF